MKKVIHLDEQNKMLLDDQQEILDNTRDRIFLAMKAKGLSQKEFATAIGTSSQTITDWKKGKSRSYMQKLPLIASILDTNLNWICNGIGDSTAPESKENQATDRLIEMAYLSRFVGYDGKYTGDLQQRLTALGIDFNEFTRQEKKPTVQDDGLSEAEQALMDMFRQLTPEQQDMVIRMVQAAADKL